MVFAETPTQLHKDKAWAKTPGERQVLYPKGWAVELSECGMVLSLWTWPWEEPWRSWLTTVHLQETLGLKNGRN